MLDTVTRDAMVADPDAAAEPMPSYDVVILGGGPCGLGAAWAMEKLRAAGEISSYVLIDANTDIGGTAASVTTAEGFIFDYGGHILFPHDDYAEFIELLDELVTEWHQSKPVRGVWIDGQLIPYPIQRNIHRLRTGKFLVSLKGLSRVSLKRRLGIQRRSEPDNLHEHLQKRFGRGLTRHVLGPLNQKMWAHSPTELSSSWTSHRSGSKVANVPDTSVRQILRSLVTRRDNLGWSEHTKVRYPLRGGTGAIWTSLAQRLPPEAMMAGTRVTEIDIDAKRLRLADGRQVSYGNLISSMPLDVLLGLLTPNPAPQLGAKLRYSNAAFIGLGLRGAPPAFLEGVHSFHMPEGDIPCWRVNFPKSLSPHTVPAGPYWSILCEISHTTAPGLDLDLAEQQIVAQLRRRGILPEGNEIVSRWRSDLRHGYPLPFLGRDEILREAQDALQAHGIYSRGRFGGWKYEVSNQDHTFMQGAEAVRKIVSGDQETTYRSALQEH